MTSFLQRTSKQVILLCTCFGVLMSTFCFAEPDSLAEQTAKDFTQVAKSAIPAVVTIKVKGKHKASQPWYDEDSENNNEDLWQRFFFGFSPRFQEREEPIQGQASGFIISSDGYVVTNGHVVQHANEIHVILNDGRDLNAKVIGFDPSTDVALVKVDAQDLPNLKFSNSDDLEIGQWAIAIGNPFGLQASLTVGVVSAKGRNNLGITDREDFIQTDAAINKGNSGGPLLDINARVIGMNTAIVSNATTGGYLGIGFAIPSNILKHVVEQLIDKGSVTRGFIGVSLQAVDQELAQAFGLKQATGALVADVSPNSPAEKVGIKQGDIIQALNRQPVMNIAALRNAIALMNPGTKILLTVLREGRILEIPVEIGLYPDAKPHAAALSGNKLGFEVQEVTPEVARSLNIKEDKGVVISKVEPNSPAAWAGLKRGVMITAVNQKPVNSVEQFNAAIQATTAGRPVLLLVKQGEIIRFISLKVE